MELNGIIQHLGLMKKKDGWLQEAVFLLGLLGFS